MRNEIGGLNRSDDQSLPAPKRRRAMPDMTTIDGLPVAAPITEIGSGDAPDGRGAEGAMSTVPQVPLGQPTHEIGAGNGSGGERAIASLDTIETVPVAANIAALSELQRQRRFCIKSQSRSDRACEAFIARYLGYRPKLPKPEGAAIWKQAAVARRRIEAEIKAIRDKAATEDWSTLQLTMTLDAYHAGAEAYSTIVGHSAAARVAWDNHLAQTKKQMRKLARGLPVWPWVEAISGFGDLGLAIIVGEAGDLAGYATKEKVWKWLGVAVINGERQQRKFGAEAAAAHGYNPCRRAELWTVADSMFRHQWRGAKDDVPAHAVGYYGEVYARRKAHTATREWTLGHRENDARRIMSKAALENLWRVWRGRPALPLLVEPPDAA